MYASCTALVGSAGAAAVAVAAAAVAVLLPVAASAAARSPMTGCAERLGAACEWTAAAGAGPSRALEWGEGWHEGQRGGEHGRWNVVCMC